jgi:hypothetical protein
MIHISTHPQYFRGLSGRPKKKRFEVDNGVTGLTSVIIGHDVTVWMGGNYSPTRRPNSQPKDVRL